MTTELFPVRWAGPLAVLTSPAEIDLSNSGELRRALTMLIDARPRTVVVDMTRTTFCDSASIALLVRASQKAASQRVRLRLAASGQVLRVLRLLEADRLIEVSPTLADALGDTTPGPPQPGWVG